MIAIESVLEKLLTYYDLDNMSQLAEKLGVTQPTISKWKSRGSILPVKKICRELGIYNEIFGDINTNNYQNARSLADINAKHFNVNSGKEVIDLLKNTQSELKKVQNEWMLGVFGDDIIKLLNTAATVIKDDDKVKESFKQHLKKFIVDNL